jgi:PAS domain S-box-containing protein
VFTTNVSRLVTLDSQLVGAIILSVALIALAVFVVVHNPRAAVNRRFGLMATTTAGWIFTISVALAAKDTDQTVILGRLGFAFASAIPFSLVWMVHAISDPGGSRLARVVIPGILCLGFVLASLSRVVVSSATPGIPRANFVYGPLHLLFGIYFLSCFASGLYTLRKTIKSAAGTARLQLRYLLLSISLTGAGAVTTNLLVPLIWSTSRYSAIGPYFSLLFFSFVAHAIIRYRLMDIRVVVREGVVYVLAILISASLFLLAAEFLRRLAGYDENRVPLFEALVVAILLATFFQPLKSWIQLWLNRYLYRGAYNYQRTVREASRRLSTMLELDPLLLYLTSVIEMTFKVEAVGVYVQHSSRKTFTSRIPRASHDSHQVISTPEIAETSPLVRLLQTDQRTLVREEAARDLHDPNRTAAAKMLRQLGGDVAFPLMDDAAIAGIIIVGPKRSGDPYFAEDIDLLETLFSQAAVAMKNAQLYSQVVLVNEYVDNILSTMESGVIVVNALGEISLFNPAAERLTGLYSSSAHGNSYRCLPIALGSPLLETLETQTPRSQFETSIQVADGTSVPLVCSTAVLRHTGGSTHGALIVFSDLTRLKELEQEQRRGERLASFGALASGIAHEIKNPLVAIRTFAELLPDRFTDSDFRDDFSKVVIREIARIDDLVGRLRGIAATAPQQAGTVDMRQPIADTLLLLRAQLEQTRTTVRCDFHDPAPFVAVEEAQLKQLFLNLLLNSIEAMGSGGELTVRLARKDFQGTQWIVVEVSDSGPGIPEAVRNNIFDPFFTTKPRGSGLGLAICRGITDAHRGVIRAENRTDRQGSTMVIEFPAVASTSSLTEEHAVRG